jgi:hypothetical protein
VIVTNPASQSFLLDQMSSAGPFFDSALIAKRASTVYGNALSWIETELGVENDPNSPTNILRQCPWEIRTFLLRLCDFRAKIDEIARVLNSSMSTATKMSISSQVLKDLVKPFLIYAEEKSRIFTELTSSKIGFDVGVELTSPFPFITSAWSPAERNDSRVEQGYCEINEVEVLFNKHMAKDAGVEKCVLRKMPLEIIERIEICLEFLQEISPKLLHEVSFNVRHIAMIDFERWPSMSEQEYREIGQSISSHLVPSCYFFSHHSLHSREKLIEAIYHEALHKKLSNILVAEPILHEGYDAASAPRFFSYWNRDTNWNGRNWEFDRALYAFHVYVHLLVFYGAILERSDIYFPEAIARRQRKLSIERATALGNWLAFVSHNMLQARGHEFLSSLNGIIKQSAKIQDKMAMAK